MIGDQALAVAFAKRLMAEPRRAFGRNPTGRQGLLLKSESNLSKDWGVAQWDKGGGDYGAISCDADQPQILLIRFNRRVCYYCHTSSTLSI